MAGVDIDMMSSVYANNLKELVEEGKVPEEVLNESVLRVLTLKNKLGLFENPYGNTDEEREKKILKSKENLEEARRLSLPRCLHQNFLGHCIQKSPPADRG